MAHGERGDLLELRVAEKLAVGFLDRPTPEPVLPLFPIGTDVEAVPALGQEQPAVGIETAIAIPIARTPTMN